MASDGERCGLNAPRRRSRRRWSAAARILDALAEESGRAAHGLGAGGAGPRWSALRCLRRARPGPVWRFAARPAVLGLAGLRAARGGASASGCELLVRWPLLLQPTDGGFALDLVGVLWLLLTGSVWDRTSWERLAARSALPESSGAAPAPLGWSGPGDVRLAGRRGPPGGTCFARSAARLDAPEAGAVRAAPRPGAPPGPGPRRPGRCRAGPRPRPPRGAPARRRR